MRLSVLIPAAAAIGAVAGMSMAFWEYGGLTTAASTFSPAPAGDGPLPTAVVTEPVHKFGAMELGGRQSHTFTIENKGEANLKLTKGNTTCKCTEFRIEDPVIGPGSSGTVMLEWKGEGEIGPFRQTATIHTNDPQQPQLQLTVEGELQEAVVIEPNELVFSSAPARDSVTGEVRIFALHSHLEVAGHRFESPLGSEQFEVVLEPLAPEELASKKATSGVLVKVTSKPILPLGPIRQKILLDTNLSTRPKLEIPISGTVVSDVSVIGPDFSMTNSTLRLGLVKRQEGAERTLRLVTRGPFRKKIKFSVSKKSPEFIDVKFGEMIEVNHGLVTQVPVTIRIPPGSPMANHLGSALGKLGEIVIETNNPEVKQVPISIRFAVED